MVCEDGASCAYEDGADVHFISQSSVKVVLQEAMLSSGFVELSCVVSIMAELEFNKGDGLFIFVFLEFVGDQCDVWTGGLKARLMLRGLLLGQTLRAGEGRSGEPVMQGGVSPLVRGPAICGEEALAFGAVRGEGFEDNSASCVVPVYVELGHGWVGASSSDVSA